MKIPVKNIGIKDFILWMPTIMIGIKKAIIEERKELI
jgi:hypothetical protein